MTVGSLLRKPSAFVPLAMSFLALALIGAVLIGVVTVQPELTGDEGAPARIFQLLIALQLPVAGSFALKWLPRATRPVITVLALQAFAVVAAVGTIVWLGW